MVEPTNKNYRKASVIADFLNNIGYFSWNFFDAGGVLKRCRDELELYWWYQMCLRCERGERK